MGSIGSGNLFISKLDASGNFVWAKQIGGSGIAVDNFENLYLVGSFSGTVDFDPGSGVYDVTSSMQDVFILKLDSSGNFIWVKKLGGTAYNTGYAIATDLLGNVYTTGSFSGTTDFDPGSGTYNLTGSGPEDIFVSKLDDSGNFVWATRMGGSSYDIGNSIKTDVLGNVYTTGYFHTTADFDPGTSNYDLTSSGSSDIFISKLNASGDFVWAGKIGGTFEDQGASISVSASGSVYTTGYFADTSDFDPGTGTYDLIAAGSAGYHNVFVLKLDLSGNFIWAKQLGGNFTDEGKSIAHDSLDNVYITGIFSNIADFDPSAAIYNITGFGLCDVFITKLDASGNFVFTGQIGGSNYEFVNSIATDTLGNIYTTGSFRETTDFDPGSGVLNYTADPQGDVFVHKMNQNTPTAIQNNTLKDDILFYPNPTSGILNILFKKSSQNVILEVYNSIGELIYQKNTQNESITIDLSGKTNGLYFIKIIINNSEVITKAVSKEW